MVRSLWFCLLFLPVSVLAQFTYVMEQAIPVKDEDGNAVRLPWAGGLNAAHYNTIDLNGDGQDDLVLFDRSGDRILTFVRKENRYEYAPDFEAFFPSDIAEWLLLRDYNCDGKKDIFTGNIFGISVFTNTTQQGEPLSWEKFLFYTGFPGNKSEALLTTGLSGNKINLKLQFDDLPSIIDADGDGDLDIFNLQFAGEGSIEFHRNYSKERYGTCDSLDFEKITQKWAGLAECDCGEFAFNNEECGPPGGRTKHAAGKSLLMLDVNGDNALDILFSEADCTNLYALPNEGTTENPVINSFTIFPEVSPVDFQIFPAAFYEDVDFDGVRDLISTPNIFSKTTEILTADLSRSNWLYKNTGTNVSPSFSLSSKSFLQDQMIDVGDNAVPAFADYDGDGDQDLFISRHTAPTQTVATVRLYENTGTSLAPEFTLVDNDAFGFSTSNFFNLKIQFADLNHDAKADLVFTATDRQSGQTRLYYLANKSSSILDFSGQPTQPVDVPLLSSENVTVVDVNNDGFQDLLIGKSNGALQLWKNQGTTSVSFSLADDTFLSISSNVTQQNISGAAGDLNADGKLDLILGDQSGVLKIISNFREVQDTTGQMIDIIFNSLAQQYQSKNLGGRVWPTVANIFNTNKPSVIVGNALGGVYILRNDEGQSLPEDPIVSIYPNPVFKGDVINITVDRPATLQMFGGLGQVITSPVSIRGAELYRVRIPYVAAGVYFLRFEAQGKFVTRRLVVK